MLHLIQKDVFAPKHYEMLVGVLERMGLEHYGVKIVDGYLFTLDDRMILMETTNVFCWGSVRMAKVASEMGWDPGSLMNSNHDYRIYSQHYGDEMLNHDSQVVRFADEFTTPGYVFFVRPCGDTKAFTGQCFIPSSWNEFVRHALASKGPNSTLNEDTMVQVSSRKDIQREYRTWVVKGKVITASQYKVGTKVVHAHCTEPMVLEYAQRIADIYHPAEAFVLDVCMTENGMKVVEVNCINCAGFYDTDLQRLVAAVEDAFDEQTVDGRNRASS